MNDFGPINRTNEREQVTSVIVAAFESDPFVRWYYPDPEEFRSGFSRIIEPIAGGAFDEGTAFGFAQPVGFALWLGPGFESDGEAMSAIIAETVREDRIADLRDVVEQMAQFHPHEPHWYLPLLGIDPSHQGKGLGSALLKHALTTVDRNGLPAYLESTSESNRRLYERLDFKVVGELQCGSSPTMWAMRREPQVR